MKKQVLKVSIALIEDLLQLSTDEHIIGIEADVCEGTVKFILYGDQFEHVMLGGEPPNYKYCVKS